MTDPSDLLRRAAELTERADHEADIETRERLLRMAHYYAQIAENEEWLAAHPASVASLTNLLTPKSD
jgi:hypothetical protein